MTCLKVLFCHLFLLALALSSPVDSKIKEKKSNAEVTTPKASTTSNISKEKVQSLNNLTEKPATKKRDIPEGFGDRSEYLEDDLYEAKPADDYDSLQALRSYLENARSENSVPEPSRFRVNDFRYFSGESRRKRTAIIDGLFNKPEGYFEPEIQMTPEDIMALAAYKQQQRIYNNFPYGRWNDVNNYIDLQDPEIENNDIEGDRQESFFDRLYDQRYQNWANMPRNEKFIPDRHRRSFQSKSKLRVPLYRRAIL